MTDHTLHARTLLGRCGLALYGGRWQTPLARALGVSDRTVRAWIAGTRGIPDGVWGDLRKLLRDRAGECAALARELLTTP